MEEYLISIFAVSAVTAILGLITYKGGDGVIKFAFAVLVLYTALAPISKAVDGFDKLQGGFIIPMPELGEGEYESVAREAFCNGVKEYICSELSLDTGDVAVSASGFDFEKMRAELIKVTLSGRAAFADRIKIEELVGAAGLGECEVQIEIG